MTTRRAAPTVVASLLAIACALGVARATHAAAQAQETFFSPDDAAAALVAAAKADDTPPSSRSSDRRRSRSWPREIRSTTT